MRRRLVITYLALLALILLALEVPLASTAASRGTDEMVLDRLVDANRYASTADAALRDGDTADLSAGLTRYHDLYGISAAGALDARVTADLGPPELRRLARSFNEMADNVADSLDRQRAFVAQASHQLRNPLTSLRIRMDNLAEYVAPAGLAEHRLTLEE